MFVSKEVALYVSFHKRMDESGCLCNGLFEKGKKLFLILGGCVLKFDLVADSIEKSQCEKFIERRFTGWLDLIQYFIKKDSVNLVVGSVVSFLSIENVHDTLLIHFIKARKDFFMNLFHVIVGDGIIDISSIDFIDTDGDLSKFKE
jgi:hypothetical protein